MRYSSKVVLAGLAAKAAASPLSKASLVSARYENIFGRQDDNPASDKATWCAPAEDLSTWDNAKLAWERIGIDFFVEVVIDTFNDGQQKNWLEAMEYPLWPEDNDSEGRTDCVSLSTECRAGRPDMTCNAFFDEWEGHQEWFAKRAYYTFRAVRGAHKKLKWIKDKLIDSTIVNGLKLEAMAQDLEGPDATSSMNKIATLMTNSIIVGGIALSASASFPMAGIWGPAIGITLATAWQGMGSDEELNIGSISDGLGTYFEGAAENLDNTVRTLMGHRDTSTDFHYSDLPDLSDPTRGTITKHDVSKFFGTPFWLLDTNSEELLPILELGMESTRLKLVDIILQQIGYTLTAHEDWDEGICGHKDSRKWIEVDGTSYCFSLWLAENTEHLPMEVGDNKNIYEKMETYGVTDLEAYYRNAIECGKNGNSGATEFDVGTVVEGGLPTCFFSMPIKWAKRVSANNSGGKCMSRNPGDTCVLSEDFF